MDYIYLDNDVFSAIAKADMPHAVMNAISTIVDLHIDKTIKLTTSKVTLREFTNYNGPHKAAMKLIYDQLQKVDFIEDHEVKGFNWQWDRTGGVANPEVADHPVAAELRSILAARIDAHHLMIAIEEQCEVFLTCDCGILHNANEIQAKFGIKVLKPQDYILNFTRSA